LDIARETEAKLVAKHPRGRPRKRPIEEIEVEEEEAIVINTSSLLDEELEESVAGRTRSKRAGLDLVVH